MPPAIAPPKNRPRNADASENTAAPHLTPQEEQVGKEENQPDSFQEAMTPNPERAIPMKGNPNPFPTMVGNQEEFVPMTGNPNSFPIMAGNPGEFIPMIPYPAAPITMKPSQEEAQETEQEPSKGKQSENATQVGNEKEPPGTYQGYPVISQKEVVIGEETDQFVQRETRFKIRPRLGGRVTENIFGISENQRIERVSQGIFEIKEQKKSENNSDVTEPILTEDDFNDNKEKEVFDPIGPFKEIRFVSDFVVYDDEFGVTAFRLGTNERKNLKHLLGVAKLNVFATLASILAEIATDQASSETGRDVLSTADLFVKALKKLFKRLSVTNFTIDQAAIAGSGSTKEEQLSLLVFQYLVLKEEAAYRVGREEEILVFDGIRGHEGVGQVVNRLNSLYNQFQNETSEIDIHSESGFRKAQRQLLK